MLSDPDLLVGQAFDLPTFSSGDVTHYRRLTLVAYDGEVERVFYPISDASAPGNARQMMTWLQTGAHSGLSNAV